MCDSSCRHLGSQASPFILTVATVFLLILAGGHASAEEPEEWVGEVNFKLEGSGNDSGNDTVNRWNIRWNYSENRNAGCSIRFCGRSGNPKILGVERHASSSKSDHVFSYQEQTRCWDPEERREWMANPGSKKESREKSSAGLEEPHAKSRWTAIKFEAHGANSGRIFATCEIRFAVTYYMRNYSYDACTGKNATHVMDLTPNAARSDPRTRAWGEKGTFTYTSGPSSPGGRVMSLPWPEPGSDSGLRGSQLISSVEGPGGTSGGKYSETITASWNVERATRGCGCVATINKLMGDVLINDQPVESGIIADASRMEITTGKTGRVALQVNGKRLTIGGNTTTSIDQLCDPPPHSPEAWERMTPAEVWKDVWGTTISLKEIGAAFSLLVGAESDFTVTGRMGMAGVRGHLDPIFRSNDDGYRLVSYDGDPTSAASPEIPGIEEVMPSQSELDAAVGGVILGGGPEEGDIAIWPLKGTVRVMDPEGRKSTLTAPENFEVEGGFLPAPMILSAEWVLLRVGG